MFLLAAFSSRICHWSYQCPELSFSYGTIWTTLRLRVFCCQGNTFLLWPETNNNSYNQKRNTFEKELFAVLLTIVTKNLILDVDRNNFRLLNRPIKHVSQQCTQIGNHFFPTSFYQHQSVSVTRRLYFAEKAENKGNPQVPWPIEKNGSWLSHSQIINC